jgi:hypothetical protein
MKPAARWAQVFRVSMAARQYSAKLELYRQLSQASAPPPSEAACCWAVVNGRTVTDAAGIAAALRGAGRRRGASSPEIYPFDHLYEPAGLKVNASDPAVLTAVLYGPIGSACAREMHAALAAAVQERGAGEGGCGCGPLALQKGVGVALALFPARPPPLFSSGELGCPSSLREWLGSF